MGQAKQLHTEWQDFKNGKGATMIKDANLKLNSGLGPKLDTLDAKWGTADGQKAAADIKKIVVQYKNLINNAQPSAKSKKGPDGNTRDSSNKSTNPYQDQKQLASAILNNIDKLASQHAVNTASKKAASPRM